MKTSRVPKRLAPELFRDLLLSIVPEFPEVAIVPLYDAHQVQSYLAGEALITEGEVCRGVYLLWGGTVQLSLLHSRDKRKHFDVRKISSPAVLGLPGTMLGHGFVASASALSQVEAAFIPRAAFMQAVREFPMASLAFSTVLSDELNSTYENLSALRSTRSARALPAN